MRAVQQRGSDVEPFELLQRYIDGIPKVNAVPAVADVAEVFAQDDPGTGPGSVHLQGTRVGMLVFNTCHADARVLRQAATLTEKGAQVRIFAVANSAYPPGLEILPNGVEIERVAVRSAFNLAFIWLAALYHVLRQTEMLKRRREARARRAQVVDLRSRRERREALRRMPLHQRAWRGSRVRWAQAGRRYRRILRRAYLIVHARLGRWLRPLHRPTQQMSFWRNVRVAVEGWSPDVAHAHDANTLVPAGLTSSGLRIPLVYDSHELWRHRNRGGRKAPVGRIVDALIETWGARRAEAVISVSPGLVSWLEDKYALTGRVHLLRNTPSRVASVEAPSLREMAGLGPGEKIVLYTGRITTGRGIEEAIGAIAGMDDHVHLVLLGYGDSEYLGQLHRYAKESGVSGRFRHVGAVPHEQVSATASQADVSVVAVQPTCLSYLHCLPNKLFEAIQAGLPVVASRLPDIDALMREHQIGETFTVGDAKDMRRALTMALMDPDSLKTNVREAASVLCWEVERERLIAVYEEILTSRLAPSDGWDDIFHEFAQPIEVPGTPVVAS